jgi:phosphatidylglycerol:prolipoprotein diacylglycerol transferase
MVSFGARHVSQAYPVVFALGCLAGLGWLAVQRGPPAQAEAHSFRAALLALAAGVFGARMAFVALHGPYFVEHPAQTLWLWQGGLSWIGGALGAVAAVGLYAGLRRLSLGRLADALAIPALLVALAAWTGCLVDHCMVGVAVPASLLALRSPDLFGVVAPRWPTAAAGMIATGLLLCLAFILEGRRLAPGLRAALALGGLSAIGLGLSFTRADPTLRLAGLRPDSLGAAVLLVAAIAFAAVVWRRPSEA